MVLHLDLDLEADNHDVKEKVAISTEKDKKSYTPFPTDIVFCVNCPAKDFKTSAMFLMNMII